MLAGDGNLFVFSVHQLHGTGMNNEAAAGIWIIVDVWRVELQTKVRENFTILEKVLHI